MSSAKPSALPNLPRSLVWVWVVVGVAAAVWIGVVLFERSVRKISVSADSGAASRTGGLPRADSAKYVPRPPGRLSFCKEIAPLIWQQCAPCHRPNQSAPFSLLSYQDVKKRAGQIAEVTSKRIMPPWPPEAGYGEFAHERRLSVEQLGWLQQWIAEGVQEGNPEDLPPPPTWDESWTLGKPDLTISLADAFTLGPDGKDVYRNFVVPIPLSASRYVKAIELRPGNPQIVHHAFMYVDRTPRSRTLAAKESEPGFPGMKIPDTARMPDGQFLSWQPGKIPFPSEDLSWPLEPGSDLVLQMHMRPTGKPEKIQPTIGFYFTERAPTKTPFKIALTSLAIDIPPGETNYVLTHSFVLPVDVDAVGILPHAHYLAKELRGFATLPDGTEEPLVLIRDWDFNWQGNYQYASPVFLPKGTTLTMRYVYDNSTNNVRNPHNPPQRVTYGPQSSDEMGELWIQVVLRHPRDMPVLARAHSADVRKVFREYADHLLEGNSKHAKAHVILGKIDLDDGRIPEAAGHFRAAIQADPSHQEAHYDLGVLYLQTKHLMEARAAFEAAIRLDPEDYQAQGSLGVVLLEQGHLPEAAEQFKKALKINPADAIAQDHLERITAARRTRSGRGQE